MEVHLTFDESRPLDTSGKRNHGSGEVMAAAGIGGAGSSAMFRNNYIYIPSTESFKSADFSYTFFVYLLEDAKSKSVLLLQTGMGNFANYSVTDQLTNCMTNSARSCTRALCVRIFRKPPPPFS